jgi:uncharacterized membrane protein
VNYQEPRRSPITDAWQRFLDLSVVVLIAVLILAFGFLLSR